MSFIFVKKPLAYLAKSNPSIGFKYLGIYLAPFLSSRARLAIFQHHYSTLAKYTNATFIENIICDKVELWRKQNGPNTYLIGMCLTKHTMEGDLALFFSCNSQRLFTFTFTIAPGAQLQIDSEHILFVSAVQGSKGHFDLIKASTKQLNDICPRVLLLEALQAIAIAMKISCIVGISAEEQSSYRFNPAGGISYNDYDYFWQSHGGEKANGQVYLMPIPLFYKPLMMVKSSHRGRAQNRRLFRKRIMEEICETFKNKCMIVQGNEMPQISL